MKTDRNFDFWLLLLWNIPAFFLSLYYGSNYLITALILIVPPAIYLTIKKPELIRKIGLVSMFLSFIGVAVVSYLAYRDGAWYIPYYSRMAFDVFSLEDFIWGIMYFYYVLAFYEYFYEKEKILNFPKSFKKNALAILAGSVLFSITAYFFPEFFVIPYFYPAFVLIFFILIPWWMLCKQPNLIVKSIKVGIFALFPHLIGEYIAAVNHNWWFPGKHFIGYVNTFGITIPVEEFLWIILAVPAIIAYYEFVADDRV